MKGRNAQYYDLLERAFGQRATCKLTEATPKDRRNGKCSACTFNIDQFEFDRVRASGLEGPSRLSHSRGMPPHTSRGPGSAAPQAPTQGLLHIIVRSEESVQEVPEAA
jgi:hypothetical protein